MDIWVLTFWLLWMMLPWTFVYLPFCGHMSLFFWGIPMSGIAGRMVTLCWTFWGIARLFPKWLYHFTFPRAAYEGSDFSTSLQILVTVFLVLTILVGVQSYLIRTNNQVSSFSPAWGHALSFNRLFFLYQYFFPILKTLKSLLNPLSLQLPSHFSLPLYNKIPQKNCLNLSPISFFILACSSFRLLSPPCHQNFYSQGHQCPLCLLYTSPSPRD